MTAYIDFRAIAKESLAALPGSNFYFLLDHGGLPGLFLKLSNSASKWESLFGYTRDASALPAAPILVLAGSKGQLQMSRNLFDWIAREGTYTSTVIMLSSPLRMEEMTEQLVARLNLKLSDDTEAMLRFFDPRVLESLCKTLSAEQSDKFFSAAKLWQFADRNGKLVRVDSTFNVEDNCIFPLELSQEQEFRLLDLSEADQVLSVLRTNVPDLAVRLPYSLQYDFVNRQIEVAKCSGLDSVLKIAIYITVQLIAKEQFLASALWPRFVDRLIRSEVDFSGFFDSEAISGNVT